MPRFSEFPPVLLARLRAGVPGMPLTRNGGGQRSSLERGSHTHYKKNPGKRTHSGGS